eukprot:4322458-Ditylum_brightwellii.AAC.1
MGVIWQDPKQGRKPAVPKGTHNSRIMYVMYNSTVLGGYILSLIVLMFWSSKWQSQRPLCCTGAPIGAPTSTPKLTTAHDRDNPAHLVYKIGPTPS